MSSPVAELSASCHAGLAYFVLSHLNLGRDAASLHIARDREPRWVPELLAAYRAAPGRLNLHFAPLQVADLVALFGWLESPPTAMGTRADQVLCARLYAAIEAETTAFLERWPEGCATLERRRELVQALEVLRPVMRALWSRRGLAAPLLQVWDAPCLGRHGRAWGGASGQIIAVSLTEPIAHVVCQVLHEAVHAVSDGEVDAQVGNPRDTRQGSAGYDSHRRLEDAAVRLGWQLVAQHAPVLLSDYRRWCARVGAVS